MMMAHGLLLLLFCLKGLLTENVYKESENIIDVPIGREYQLKRTDLHLSFESPEQSVCKVEVVNNEPITLRVGSFEPKIFDCDFPTKTVKYSHFGSYLLKEDSVKLRAFLFLENVTLIEVLTLKFNIITVPYQVTSVLRPLTVEKGAILSNPISSSVLNFNYNRKSGSICKIRYSHFQSPWPSKGNLVMGSDQKTVDVIKRKCDDFIQQNLAYRHLQTPSPDMDYIQLSVEISDPLLNEGELFVEYIHLPVILKSAQLNTPPRSAFSSMYMMDVDQFILTTITPSVLMATDVETSADQLIFNISKPLLSDQGSVVHLADQSKSITSFTQSDLNNYNIAYKPPSLSFLERKTFEIRFTIWDSMFMASDEIALHIAVRPALTVSPRVAMNVGLVLLEGQSRPILPQNMEIVDGDTEPERITVYVTGGLLHGTLFRNMSPIMKFTYNDILQHNIVYKHDDTDSLRDHIQFRITDSSHSTNMRFHINIIPKDDTPPYLITNLGLRVVELQSTKLSNDLLNAKDDDTEDEYILYHIFKKPIRGVIWRKFHWEKVGVEVSKFTQRDINKGFIYYHHTGGKEVNDELEITLEDINRPPNVSPSYAIAISIATAGNEPPIRDPHSLNKLEVKETDIGLITSDNLHYIDLDNNDGNLKYTITSHLKYMGDYTKPGTGKVVSLVDQVLPVSKQLETEAATTFTQNEVNAQQVAYFPPHGDIGPYPLYLQFIFSVTDVQGNILPNQLFNITIFPVNNQMPELKTGTLQVNEGGSVLVSTNELSIYDPDSLIPDLQISLFSVPLHGSLRKNNHLLRVGDLLSLDDVLSLRLEYVHDGSESFKDSFKVGVNDGVHFVDGEIKIQIIPVDDELPRWKDNLEKQLSVEEGSSVPITSKVLAAVDSDTEDSLLIFVVKEPPQHGILVIDHKLVTRFAQKEVVKGRVQYIHNSKEIGSYNKHDSFVIQVLDRSFPHVDTFPTHQVSIAIQPLNSHPPKVAFHRAIFVEEGQSAPLSEDILSAIDDDTPENELIFIVLRGPNHGYISRLPKGSERMAHQIHSFSMSEIKARKINYEQSDHRNIEPESDVFDLIVTDGTHNSSTISILVNIILRNDEEPKVIVHNLTVSEGESFPITSENFLVKDSDYPADLIMISLETSPACGQILRSIPLDAGGNVEFPFKTTDLENFYHTTFYRHDGSENFIDSITFGVSDGVHNISVKMYVYIIPVNDESPRLVRNEGLKEVVHGSWALITPRVLKAVDDDIPFDELIYQLTVLPSYGTVEVQIAKRAQEFAPLLNNFFTQSQVDAYLIRYKQNVKAFSSNEDYFNFTLFDGIHSTEVYTFNIQLMATFETSLQVVTDVMTVEAGNYVILNSTFISIQEFEGDFEALAISVILPPKFGQLERIENPGVSILYFTYLDVVGGLVVYNHTHSELMANDSFDFTVSDEFESQNATLDIVVLATPDDQSFYPRLKVIKALQVNVNGSSVISQLHLKAEDDHTSPDKLHFVLAEGPTHGQLLRANELVDSFTQEDVNNHLIVYSHSGLSNAPDSFLFRVMNGRATGYLVDDKVSTEPTIFEIIVEAPPAETTVLVNSPHQIEEVSTGLMGFVLSADHIKAAGPHSANTSYYIRKGPQHAYLLHRTLHMKVAHVFTQQQLDSRILAFVINASHDVSNDSLEFTAVDGQGQHLPVKKLEFQWSVLEFAYREYSVCEDAGTVSIVVLRAGDLSRFSYAKISSLGETAHEGEDFVPSPAQLIQFSPGSSSATWTLQVVEDSITETSIEQLHLELSDPVDAVIGSQGVALINIHDKIQGRCPLLPASQQDAGNVVLEATTTPVKPTSKVQTTKSLPYNINQMCTHKISGLLHFDHISDQLYQCDGHTWKPWSRTPAHTVHSIAELNRETGCLRGWKSYAGMCHRWFRQAISWSLAEKRCQRHSSNLVAVLSASHNNWLFQFTKHRPFWIGLHTIGPRAEWSYTSQLVEGKSYQGWKEGFPKSSKWGEVTHRCVIMRGTGVWINRHCDLPHAYVCATPSKTVTG